jgi:hypothetical protein
MPTGGLEALLNLYMPTGKPVALPPSAAAMNGLTMLTQARPSAH